jgi:hypothetical protein
MVNGFAAFCRMIGRGNGALAGVADAGAASVGRTLARPSTGEPVAGRAAAITAAGRAATDATLVDAPVVDAAVGDVAGDEANASGGVAGCVTTDAGSGATIGCVVVARAIPGTGVSTTGAFRVKAAGNHERERTGSVGTSSCAGANRSGGASYACTGTARPGSRPTGASGVTR